MAEIGQNYFLIEGDVYEVEKLVGTKIVNGKKLYRVRWKGYSAQSDTLEPEENLFSCKDMILELEEKLERKRRKKLLKGAKQMDETVVLPESSSEIQESGESSRDPSKDTFWKDFNEGKINVFGQDMYSKVKERASRSVIQTDPKTGETQNKEAQPLVCPKVVLKRRTHPKSSSVVPTYKSTLHIKPLSIQVKRRKRHDVLRDYRKRKYRSYRKRNADENKLLQARNNAAGTLYQNMMKPRAAIPLSKPSSKNDILEGLSAAEYSKVLQELPANDEMDTTDFATPSLSNFTLSKLLMDLPKIHPSSRTEDYNSNSWKNIDDKEQVNILSTKVSKQELDKTEMSSKLNVVSSEQIQIWRSLKINDILDKILNAKNGSQTANWHSFDLLMASSIQGRIDAIEKLCKNEAPLNQVLSDGTTMMMIVSEMGLHDVVKIFLQNDAHKDIQNKFGETALMLACRHKFHKVVKLLLEHGANFALTNSDGINALRISNKYEGGAEVSKIMNEHISRMKLEFEGQARLFIEPFAMIRYALFPLQCFSLSEGPKFHINFSHHVELESPGKGSKEYLLFIANCIIKGSYIKCEFNSESPVLSATLNGSRQVPFKKEENFLIKISSLQTGNNEVCITTAQKPRSEIKLVVCAYRVHYRRSYFTHSATNMLTKSPHF